MDDDNHHSLSALWRGRRRPFTRLMRTLSTLGVMYDVRNGTAAGTGDNRFRVAIQDVHGEPITGTCTLPVEALDDLLLAVEDIRKRRRQENKAQGYALQYAADSDLAHMAQRAARGEQPDFVRERARGYYEEAARRTTQPDLTQLTTPGTNDPKEN